VVALAVEWLQQEAKDASSNFQRQFEEQKWTVSRLRSGSNLYGQSEQGFLPLEDISNIITIGVDFFIGVNME
jgi:hypothetical protein